MKKINILKIQDEDIYYTEGIIKKRGKERKIFKPSESLSKVQKNILLQIKEYFFSLEFNNEKYYKNLSINRNEFKHVYSYIRKKNIADMARNHVGKKYVVRMDIKGFFNSITNEMVEKYMKIFFENNEIEIENFDYFLNLVTYNNSLPIGAITSPFISNVVGYYLLDKKITSYIELKGITYSRYADDLIFSSNNEDIKNYIENIKKLINQSGFEENNDKRKIYHNGKRQLVTGICVNGKKIKNLIFENIEPTIPIEKRREIRYYLHLINKKGIDEALKFYQDNIFIYKKKPKKRKKVKYVNEETFLRIIEGKINYFNMINKSQSDKLKKDFKLITSF